MLYLGATSPIRRSKLFETKFARTDASGYDDAEVVISESAKDRSYAAE
jgi:hypothetical protein